MSCTAAPRMRLHRVFIIFNCHHFHRPYLNHPGVVNQPSNWPEVIARYIHYSFTCALSVTSQGTANTRAPFQQLGTCSLQLFHIPRADCTCAPSSQTRGPSPAPAPRTARNQHVPAAQIVLAPLLTTARAANKAPAPAATHINASPFRSLITIPP